MKTKTFRKVHTYVGVSAAIFLILAGSTGTLLTFRGEFSKKSIVVPEVIREMPTQDLSSLLSRAKAVMGAEIAWVRFSSAASKPLQIRFRDSLSTTLYYSPSGQLLARRDNSEWSLVGFVFDLHTGAMMGRGGELTMGLVGLLLTISSVSGVLIWPFLLRRRRSRELASVRMVGV
jgi:uncharacterized iron-regulated membrane protein